MIVEHFFEIDGKIFEYVDKHTINNTTFYIAVFVPNNSIAIDYIVPYQILNPTQIEILEKEL